MATRTTAPRAKRALYDLLLQRYAGAGVDVTWDAPSRKVGRDLVYLGSIAQDQDPAAVGRQRFEEAFTLTVLISVMRSFADAPDEAADRVFAIYEQLEDLIGDDPTIGDTVREANIRGWDHDSAADNEAGWRESSLSVRVECEARI